MSVIATAVKHLLAAGVTGDALIAAIAEMESSVQPKRSSGAERTARWRENMQAKRHECVTSVTSDNPPTPPKDNNTNLDIKNNPPLSPPLPPNSRLHGTNPRATASEPDGFEAFWTAYPKRDGNADRKGAAKAFGAATKRAEGHEIITRAAARYAAHCREKGKLGTEFVKQARSWLNGDLWREWVPQELPAEITSSRVYVQTGSDAMDAWDAFYKRTKGKMAPRDQRGGWYFETEFPPEDIAA